MNVSLYRGVESGVLVFLPEGHDPTALPIDILHDLGKCRRVGTVPLQGQMTKNAHANDIEASIATKGYYLIKVVQSQ